MGGGGGGGGGVQRMLPERHCFSVSFLSANFIVVDGI